jgi:hypothetical protein
MIALLGGYLSGLVPWRRVAELCIAALSLVVVFAAGHYGGIKAERAVMQAKLDAIVQADQKALIQAQQDAAAETERRLSAARSQDHEDLTRAEKRADAAAAVGTAAERLRQRTEAVAATCRSDPAAASVSPAARSPGLVLADVQRRLVEAAGRFAAYADEARDAAESCANRYDALTAVGVNLGVNR